MLCIVLPAALGTVADRIDGVAGDAERALGREAGPWAVPVSYTHLDVYKRQACAPCS